MAFGHTGVVSPRRLQGNTVKRRSTTPALLKPVHPSSLEEGSFPSRSLFLQDAWVPSLSAIERNNTCRSKQTTWQKIKWTWQPESDREAGDSVVRNFLLHWFPAKVAKESLSWGYSFWLGTVSAVLFLILVLTGVPLMFLYVPSVERAYLSVKDIEFVVSFGWFLRGLHRVSAHLMVAVVFLHLVRVFLTGAYKNGTAVQQNRPLNWIVGVALLLVTLFLSFTGYLLPWDQLAYWAITVGTNIASAAPVVGEPIRFLLLGGATIDQNALIRFYVLHCFFLPLGVLLLFSYHMWRVRKDGGLACVDRLSPRPEEEPRLHPARVRPTRFWESPVARRCTWKRR